MATLETIIVRLNEVSQPGELTRTVEHELEKALYPFKPLVKASILNIPTHGTKHTGLRMRLTRCVQTFAKIDSDDECRVGIYMDVDRMPSGQYALPLTMEGVKEWLHPVFGGKRWDPDTLDDLWVTQEPHEYFYDALVGLGPAAEKAIERAVDRIGEILSS